MNEFGVFRFVRSWCGLQRVRETFPTHLIVALATLLVAAPNGLASTWPFDQADADAVNSLLQQALTSSSTSKLEVKNVGGQQVLTGTVDGQAIDPPVPLKWGDDAWLEKSKSDGAATQRTAAGYNSAVVLHEDIKVGEVVKFLIHEAAHVYLGCYFPGFALHSACNDCEHLWVWAASASMSCESAQNCQTDEAARDELVAWANAERQRCIDASAANPCSACPENQPTFPNPPCPAECTAPQCN